VFSFGWDRPDIEVPEGSAVDAIDLTRPPGRNPAASGPSRFGRTWPTDTTEVERTISPPVAALAEGRDPGPSVLADQRVPSANNFDAHEQSFRSQRAVLRSRRPLLACRCRPLDHDGLPLPPPNGDFFASWDHRAGHLVG
jgi:hypothetical protein